MDPLSQPWALAHTPSALPHLVTWSRVSPGESGCQFLAKASGWLHLTYTGRMSPALPLTPPSCSFLECLSLLLVAAEGLRATVLGGSGNSLSLFYSRWPPGGIKMTLVYPKSLHVGNGNLLEISLLCRERKKSETHVCWGAGQRWENPARLEEGTAWRVLGQCGARWWAPLSSAPPSLTCCAVASSVSPPPRFCPPTHPGVLETGLGAPGHPSSQGDQTMGSQDARGAIWLGWPQRDGKFY